jgi:hypothetical protein
MNRDEMIKRLVEENLSLCQNNMEVNDGVIFDLLMYGFKGYQNMTIQELEDELGDLDIDEGEHDE